MKKAMKIIGKIILMIGVVYIFTIPFTIFISEDLRVEINSIQNTITEARETAYEIELTGVTQQVLEYNKTLAKYQWVAKQQIFKYHFTESFRELKAIK